MQETIPLFPLGSVLFPRGRMALQIFEPRYLDLVSSCLKSASGFGVVWLRDGSEVYSPERESALRLAQIGTYATIVDWDALPNKLLGITIEGTKKFRLLSSYRSSNHLQMAEIEWLPDKPMIALLDETEELKTLLQQLLQHPHIERLQLAPALDDGSSVSFLLAQLLPIAESLKFKLLSIDQPQLRLQQLMTLLEELNQ